MLARPTVDWVAGRGMVLATAGAAGAEWNGSFDATGCGREAQEQNPQSPTADHQGMRRRTGVVGLTLYGGKSLLV